MPTASVLLPVKIRPPESSVGCKAQVMGADVETCS